jgi:YD repeat-containing protein
MTFLFRFAIIFLGFFLLIPVAFARDGEGEWQNLENALKQQGIIQDPNQPTTTTEKLPDGSTHTVRQNSDGRRTETTVRPNGETETKYTGGDPGKTGPTEITDVSRADGSRTTTVHYVTGVVGQTVSQRDGSSVSTTTYPEGGGNTVTRDSKGNITRETFTDTNGVTRSIDTVYGPNGKKQRKVHRDAQGQIEEVIYYNPDGSWNRTSRDPNAPPRYQQQIGGGQQTSQVSDGNAFGDGVGVAGGKFDTTGMESQIAQADHPGHHDHSN